MSALFGAYYKSRLTKPGSLFEVKQLIQSGVLFSLFFFAIFWQAPTDRGGGKRMLNSIKRSIIPRSVRAGLTHTRLMAAHNQGP